MAVVHYGGWEIHVYKNTPYPPFLDFTATCWQGKAMRFNVEGRTAEEAIEKAKEKITKATK